MVKEKNKKSKEFAKLLKRIQKKLMIFFVVVIVCLCALVGRLTYINYTSGEKYQKKVLSMQSYDSVTIPYQRGDIVDRNGNILDVNNYLGQNRVVRDNGDGTWTVYTK